MNAKTFLIAILGSLTVLSARAQNDMFQGKEWSFDVLGSWASHNRNGGDDAFGLGVGANYYFTENFGAGVDTYADAFKIPYLINFSGLYRYPLRQYKLAPYGFAGFGRQWDHSAQWTGHIGVGAEYQLQRRSAIFLDIREVFPTETRDFTVIRIGFRFGIR